MLAVQFRKIWNYMITGLLILHYLNCGHCNRIKGNRGQEYLITRLNEK